MSTGHHLELREEGGGLGYFLDGRPVQAGVVLEVLLEGGEWLTVRFEWKVEDQLPTLHLDLGETQSKAIFCLPERARFRWRL